MEKEIQWPEEAGKQPEDWETWGTEAKKAFTEIWESETPEGRKDLLEESKKRDNQQEWEDWLLTLNDLKKYSNSMSEKPMPLFGCLPLLSIALAIACMLFL